MKLAAILLLSLLAKDSRPEGQPAIEIDCPPVLVIVSPGTSHIELRMARDLAKFLTEGYGLPDNCAISTIRLNRRKDQ